MFPLINHLLLEDNRTEHVNPRNLEEVGLLLLLLVFELVSVTKYIIINLWAINCKEILLTSLPQLYII